MQRITAIAIFDIGKTNKKLLLFNEQYQVLHEESRQFKEIEDEDGFPCEDIEKLSEWVKERVNALLGNERYTIKAINFSAYGASFVLLNEKLELIPSLYNYLKPFPSHLSEKIYSQYPGLDKQSASPRLGNLNSGLQLYRLKHEKPGKFARIRYALHLPQYLSFLLTGKTYSDLTSIGCHTHLWNYETGNYHSWVIDEGIDKILAPIIASSSIAGYINNEIPVGVGLHDSSSALIPYLLGFEDPFVLLSTGTWCISLNPFNHSPLTVEELSNDCLCYLSYTGNAVKASRLFAGNEHELQVKRLAAHFNKAIDFYKNIPFDKKLLPSLSSTGSGANNKTGATMPSSSLFSSRLLDSFHDYETAYHQLLLDLVIQQKSSTSQVMNTVVKKIFVDGGFSKNEIYMQLLANAFPDKEVYASEIAQASAIGAAICLHGHWNPDKLPDNIIHTKRYLPVDS
jgi:sugar (pentulose or hexulose) kinase